MRFLAFPNYGDLVDRSVCSSFEFVLKKKYAIFYVYNFTADHAARTERRIDLFTNQLFQKFFHFDLFCLNYSLLRF